MKKKYLIQTFSPPSKNVHSLFKIPHLIYQEINTFQATTCLSGISSKSFFQYPTRPTRTCISISELIT